MTTWPDSTLDGLEPAGRDRYGLLGRRLFLGVLATAVVAGAAGAWGVRSATAVRSEGGWTIEVRYAATARAGLDVPLEITGRREDGFDGPVTPAVTADYFDIFETQGFTPEPNAFRRDGELAYLEFDTPPEGEVLVVAYDAYVQPSSQRGADAVVGVWDGSRVLAPVPVDTGLLP